MQGEADVLVQGIGVELLHGVPHEGFNGVGTEGKRHLPGNQFFHVEQVVNQVAELVAVAGGNRNQLSDLDGEFAQDLAGNQGQ